MKRKVGAVLICLIGIYGILIFSHKVVRHKKKQIIDRQEIKVKEDKKEDGLSLLCPDVTAREGEMVILRLKGSKYVGIESEKKGGVWRYKIYDLIEREDGILERKCIKTEIVRKEKLEDIYTHGISIRAGKEHIKVTISYPGHGSIEIGLLGKKELTKEVLEEVKYKKAVNWGMLYKMHRFYVPIRNGETGIVRYSEHEYLFVVPHKDNRWEGEYEVYFYDSRKGRIIKEIKKENLTGRIKIGKSCVWISKAKPGEYMGEPDVVYLRMFPLDNNIKFGIYKGTDVSKIDLKKIKFFDAGL